MQAMSQASERPIKRASNPLMWPKRQPTAIAATVEVAVQEVNLLPELEEFLRRSTPDVPYVPGREGLLG